MWTGKSVTLNWSYARTPSDEQDCLQRGCSALLPHLLLSVAGCDSIDYAGWKNFAPVSTSLSRMSAWETSTSFLILVLTFFVLNLNCGFSPSLTTCDTLGVNLSLNGCLFYMSAPQWAGNLSRMYPASCPRAAGIGSSLPRDPFYR